MHSREERPCEYRTGRAQTATTPLPKYDHHTTINKQPSAFLDSRENQPHPNRAKHAFYPPPPTRPVTLGTRRQLEQIGKWYGESSHEPEGPFTIILHHVLEFHVAGRLLPVPVEPDECANEACR
jgi:hypothetical protein